MVCVCVFVLFTFIFIASNAGPSESRIIDCHQIAVLGHICLEFTSRFCAQMLLEKRFLVDAFCSICGSSVPINRDGYVN